LPITQGVNGQSEYIWVQLPRTGAVPLPITRRTLDCGRILLFSSALLLTEIDRAPAQAKGLVPLSAMNAKLDTLEHTALSSANPDERRSAVIAIAAAGWLRSQPPPPPPPYPGIVARLASIYRQSDDYWVRYAIIGSMTQEAERAEAAQFLAEASARQPEPGPPPPEGVERVGNEAEFPLPYNAIRALMRMGPEGQAVLERLHALGTVREPMARAQLDTLARHGFKEPPRR
jgi:hypothetical protein